MREGTADVCFCGAEGLVGGDEGGDFGGGRDPVEATADNDVAHAAGDDTDDFVVFGEERAAGVGGRDP